MQRARSLTVSCVFVAMAAGLAAHAQDGAVAALGKQRAAASKLQWDVREGKHPTLGDIRFAYLQTPVATAIGKLKISSRAFLSCERSNNKIALEIAHGMGADDTGGLQPSSIPRLMCNTVGADKRAKAEEIETRWSINALGDVLARGLQPAQLMRCASIGVQQDVKLPPGLAPGVARVVFDITPYSQPLEPIITTCGERTAVAAAPSQAPVLVPQAPPPVAQATAPVVQAAAPPLAITPQLAAPPAAQPPAATPPPTPAPQRVAEVPWRKVKTVTGGRTIVRAAPNTSAATVTRLEAGTLVYVQSTGTEWWKARAATGELFDGYIREDRLVLK